MIVKIKIYGSKIIKFVFFDLVYFIDRGENFIMDFCKNISESEFFKQAIAKIYDRTPINISYQLFQFLDVGDNPFV